MLYPFYFYCHDKLFTTFDLSWRVLLRNPSLVFWTTAEQPNGSTSRRYSNAQEVKTTIPLLWILSVIIVYNWSKKRHRLSSFCCQLWTSFGPFIFDGCVFFTGDSAHQRAVRILRQTVFSTSILSFSERPACSLNTGRHVDRWCSQASVYGKLKSINRFLPIVCSPQWSISVIDVLMDNSIADGKVTLLLSLSRTFNSAIFIHFNTL